MAEMTEMTEMAKIVILPNELIDRIMMTRLLMIIDEEFRKYKKIMIEDESYYACCDYFLRTMFDNLKKKKCLSRKESKFVGKHLKYLIYKEELKGYVIEQFFGMGMTLSELPVEMYNLDFDDKYFLRWANPTWISNEPRRWRPLWRKFKTIKDELNRYYKITSDG